MVVSVGELINVGLEVFRANAVVGASYRPLELGPESFNRIRMGITPNIFFLSVFNDEVFVPEPRYSAVAWIIVGHKGCSDFNVLSKEWHNGG